MFALTGPAKNESRTARTPARSITRFHFFDIIPLIGTPPNVGLQLLFLIKVHIAGEKAANAVRY
jgi:hypothetical protein